MNIKLICDVLRRLHYLKTNYHLNTSVEKQDKILPLLISFPSEFYFMGILN